MLIHNVCTSFVFCAFVSFLLPFIRLIFCNPCLLFFLNSMALPMRDPLVTMANWSSTVGQERFINFDGNQGGTQGSSPSAPIDTTGPLHWLSNQIEYGVQSSGYFQFRHLFSLDPARPSPTPSTAAAPPSPPQPVASSATKQSPSVRLFWSDRLNALASASNATEHDLRVAAIVCDPDIFLPSLSGSSDPMEEGDVAPQRARNVFDADGFVFPSTFLIMACP